MDAIIGPISDLLKCLCSPISELVKSAWNRRSNFEKLKKEVGLLYCVRADIEEKIKRSGKVETRQFQDWSDEVEEIKNRVDRIEADNELDIKCLNGCFPNVSSCMKLGEEISATLIEKIPDLKERSNKNHDNFMVDPPTPPVETIPAPDTKPGSSIDSTLEEVMKSVRDEGIHKIGIWGMGGVGKTTLMEKLNNLPGIAQIFKVVIWVTVSQDWNIRKVQDVIGRRLSLDLNREMTDDEVSRKIHKELEKTKDAKYLLLLDDVWERVDLTKVGIPNSDNRCKIVLTTRSQQVCTKMETDRVIQVKALSEVEAWGLFCEKVGNNIINSLEIQPFARDVAKECAGLPLAIIVVGGVLRDEGDVRVWRNALKELKSANPSEIKDMEKEVFGPLKFSYDKLDSDDRKRCFLFGALYPEDYEIPIDEMIEYWRASGFLDGAGRSLSDAYDRGHAILSHLINASLFEQRFVSHKRKECVKMHDVIRDLALRITSMEGNKFFVGTGIESCFPRDEQWQEFHGVSLISNGHGDKQVKLPDAPMCRILSTLILRHIRMLPESFFKSMTALRVLDLSGTNIKSLPPSIRRLVNLRGLYLQDCDYLVELSSEIGALERLEVLRLGCSSLWKGIKYLAMEVGQLTNLKCLWIPFGEVNESSSIIQRRRLPKGILSRLSQLEDLRIFFNSLRDEEWVWNVAEIIEEVYNLSALNHLTFGFPRLEQFERFINRNEAWKNGTLSSFFFTVNGSDERDYYIPVPAEFDVAAGPRLEFSYGVDMIPDVIKQVLGRGTQRFDLWYHKGIRRLSELGVENLTSLTYLLVYECPKIETTLIDRDCVPANLETLKLYSCDGVKNVFSQGTIQHLTNLKVLVIYNCKGVSEVIAGDDAEYSNALPRLERLELYNLPILESICKQVLAWPSIKEVDISNCGKLRSLPFGSHNSATLKRISCGKTLWEALRWEDDGAKEQLQYAANLINDDELRSLPFGNNSATLKTLWEALRWEDDGAKEQLQYAANLFNDDEDEDEDEDEALRWEDDGAKELQYAANLINDDEDEDEDDDDEDEDEDEEEEEEEDEDEDDDDEDEDEDG